MNKLQKIKNYYKAEKENRPVNFYDPNVLKYCFIKLENKDYWNIKG